MADNSAEYEIKLKDLFSKQLDAIEAKMNGFENKINSVGTTIGNVFGGNLLAQAASKAIGYIEDIGKSIVTLGANMEQNRLVFKTMFGDEAYANRMISKFQDFAQITPFSTNDVLSGAKGLLATGFDPDAIIPSLKKLGDISAGLGTNLEDLIWLYGKAKTMGTLDAVVLKEFQKRRIGLTPGLAELKGVNQDQVRDLFKDRKITFEDVDKVLTKMTSKGGKFFNLMEESSKLTKGRWERLLDTVERAETKMGEAMNPTWNKFLDDAFDAINRFSNIDMSPLIATLETVWDMFKNIGKTIGEITDIFKNDATKSWGDVFMRDVRLLSDTMNLVVMSINTVLHPSTIGDFGDKLKNFNDNISKREQEVSDKRYINNTRSRLGMTMAELFPDVYAPKPKQPGEPQVSDDGYNKGSGVEKIQAGSRNIYLNIGKLIETVNFTKSYQQSEEELKDMLTRALLSEVNNVNIAAD